MFVLTNGKSDDIMCKAFCFTVLRRRVVAEKDLKLTVLFDIYGGLLSESEKEAFEYYYCDDLSLSEIAENTGWSRQGARDNIVRAEKALKNFEEKLKLNEKFADIEHILNVVKELLDEGKIKEAKVLIETIKL